MVEAAQEDRSVGEQETRSDKSRSINPFNTFDCIFHKLLIQVQGSCLEGSFFGCMGWLWLAGLIKSKVSFAKEPYKRDDILPERPIIFNILLAVTTPQR